MKIFANTNNEATGNLTKSLTDQTQTQVPPLFFGDNLPLEIYLHNGAEGFPDEYTEATITIAIGSIASDTTYGSTSGTLTASEQRLNTTLDLRTQAFDLLTEGIESTNAIFEIQVQTQGNTNSRTIHQSTIQIRNQMLSQQAFSITIPTAPSNVVVEMQPVPDAPTNVEVIYSPAAPSNVTATAQTIPAAPSNVTAGILPEAPSNVVAATAVAADAISEVYAYEVAAWNYKGTTKYSPLKIRIEETSPGSLDGTTQLLKGKTFVWDGSELWEPPYHFAGSSYNGAPVYRAGGEEPGNVESYTGMTAQRAFDLQIFRIILTDPGGSSPGWKIQYPRPEGMWEGGGIGQIGWAMDTDRIDPAFAETFSFRIRPRQWEPEAPSNVEAEEIITIPAAPTNVVVKTKPAAPSNVEAFTLCYDQDPSGAIELGKLAMCIQPFGLAPAPNNNYSLPGELFRIDQITSGSTPIKLTSMQRSAFSFVSNQTTGSKARGIDWELLQTASCDIIQNFDIKVEGIGADGYYQIINPNYGFYNAAASGVGRFTQSSQSGSASLYKRIRFLDCSIDTLGFYIYRHQWSGDDFIVQEWQAAQVVTLSSNGGGSALDIGQAGDGARNITEISGISTATGSECLLLGNTPSIGDLRKVTGTWENAGSTTIIGEILEIEFISSSNGKRYLRSDGTKIWSNHNQYLNLTEAYTRPANEIMYKMESPNSNSYDFYWEGYYTEHESRSGYYDQSGNFIEAATTEADTGTQNIVGFSALRKVKNLDCSDPPATGNSPIIIYRTNWYANSVSNNLHWVHGTTTLPQNLVINNPGGGDASDSVKFNAYQDLRDLNTTTLSQSTATACTAAPGTPVTHPISFANLGNTYAIGLNGTNQYMHMHSSVLSYFQTGASVTAWVNPSNVGTETSPLSSHDVIISKMRTEASSGGTYAALVMQITNRGKPNIYFYDGDSTRSIEHPDTIPANEWTHLCFTFDSNGTAIYVNGVAYTHTLGNHNTEASATGGNVCIGRIEFSGSHNYFGGQLDEIATFNKVLTATEVTAIYNNGDLSARDPVNWYRMGDNNSLLYGNITPNSSHTIIPDMGDAGLSGTLMGGAGYSTSVPT